MRNGLLALYDFQSVEGDIVKDLSGLGEPADLKIRALEAARVSDGSVELLRPTTIRSLDRVEKISDMVRMSGELTVEVWVKPSARDQHGMGRTRPGRILSMSNGKDQRNFTLAQEGDRFGTQFRIIQGGVDAWPSPPPALASPQPELTHVVYTRDRTGRARVFLNGKQAAERMVPGDTSDWEKTSFFLGNEPKINEPWLGTYYLVAVYGRDLMPGEVARNFRAGPTPP